MVEARSVSNGKSELMNRPISFLSTTKKLFTIILELKKKTTSLWRPSYALSSSLQRLP
ncbi:hypothetical protein C2S51_028150 [Perilla frutescens var. frutescens]|nr:hypothetical protein C2S51_028150 [Perilla frutescens var. frutescens]